MDLDQLLKTIKETQDVANIELSEPKYRHAIGGWQSRKNNAVKELETLRKTYGAEILQRSVGLLVTGPNAKVNEFAGFVKSIGEALWVDVNELYTKIAEYVEPTIGSQRVFNALQVSRIYEYLYKMTTDMGLRAQQTFSPNVTAVTPTFRDVVMLTKRLLQDVYGDDLNAFYLKERVLQEALSMNYTGNLVPVVIVGLNPEEVNNFTESFTLSNLFPKGKHQIDLLPDDIINKEFVANTFKRLNKKPKTK